MSSGSPGDGMTTSFEVFEHLTVGPLGCNCYIVGDAATAHAVVIDPGGDVDAIAGSIVAKGLTVTAIVATHAHFDHILAAERLKEITGAPFHLHTDDRSLLEWMQDSVRLFLGAESGPPPEVDTAVREGDMLVAGNAKLEIVHTPGHSPGSISLVADGAIFSGDTLFAGSIGRTDLPGGDTDLLLDAVRTKLFTFGDETSVFPGHGPATTIGREKATNPFVGTASRLWLPPD